MKRGLACGVGLVLAFGLASTASAQAAKKQPEKPMAAGSTMSAETMKPSPEMEKMKWMAGTWQCSGKTLASAFGPEHPVESTVSAEPILDGMWFNAHYREKKTPQNPMPVSGEEFWSYDAAGKAWTRIVIDNFGGTGKGTSSGWDKGKLVWMSDGTMGGQKVKLRETFTEKNPRELAYAGEIAGADGKMAPIWELACKK